VDQEALATALGVARSAELLSNWRPRDWPALAVELLLAGIDDLEVAELAGLSASVTGWETDPLAASLYARLLATDLRLRPATVTAPMIRMVAGLAVAAPESGLATQCSYSEEYLDCDCVPKTVPEAELEAELENLTPLTLPDGLVQVLARPLRSTLPRSQPPHGH